jgi:DNA-binding NarL/FixJ family response regulator
MVRAGVKVGQIIRVMVVDDHPLLREGIAAAVNAEADMRVVAEAGHGAEAVERFRDLRPDVVLMDLVMPGMNGIEAMLAIRRQSGTARVVVLAADRGDAQAARALEAGACGYLHKSMPSRELVDTVRRVHGGRRCVPPEIATEIATHMGREALSRREVQVLELVAAGNANKLVANQLGITEDTAKAHMKKILLKLDARDRTHAVAIAIKRGIVDL